MKGRRAALDTAQLIEIGRRSSAVCHCMETSQLAQTLAALGCPAEKSAEMAAQLDKRAHQLAGTKGGSHAEALQHLLTLMRQGWASAGRSQQSES